MRNYIQHVKEKLLESIQSLASQKKMFVLHRDKDFSRNRKLPFETMIKLILELEGNTLDHELRHYYSFSLDMPTVSSFVQRRGLISPDAFLYLFHTSHIVVQNKHRKHTYQLHFSAAVDICRQFLLDRSMFSPPDVEALSAEKYQRLKDEENDRLKLEWDAKRFLSKNNYLIHTDAIKNYVLPQSNHSKSTEWLVYADEADLLNVALFGCTAKEWHDTNPVLAAKQNIRDFASIAQLTVLSNLETHNAEMIKQGIDKAERFDRLKQIAEYQLRVLTEAEAIQKLPKGNDNE